MASIILLFICLLIGYFLKWYHLVEDNSFKTLNTLVIYVALPALTLQYIPNIEINIDLIFPILMPWINIVLSWVVFGYVGKRLGWGKALTGAVIIMTGFGNTSFVGIPVIQALYGSEGIETVIMIDQPGSFVALSTLGILIANIYSDKDTGDSAFSSIINNIIKFPPFIAFVVGVVLNIAQIGLPAPISSLFETLGRLVVPLALISVGMQVEFEFKSAYWKYVWIGLGFKLLLFPTLIFVFYFLVLKQRGQIIEITLLEAAMAPMITAGIVASSYNLKPKYCSLMLSVGILLSFVFIPLWYWLINVVV